jgi:NAD(P)-dependent dehydrogenase (short-subunit alcohol dehydrogenase family)
MGRMTGKVAVVTGTSRGLGKAIADLFAAEGARVITASRSEGTDIAMENDVRKLFARATEMGRLDVLVNNAGLFTPRKPLVDVTLEEWEASIRTNLTGVFLCMREALRIMIPRKEGLILNVSSGVSTRAAPTWGPYAAAKWGVEGLTKLAAEEAKESGVRMAAVNPSRTRTPMRAAAYPEEDPSTVKTPEATARYYLALAVGEVAFETGASLDYEEGY